MSVLATQIVVGFTKGVLVDKCPVRRRTVRSETTKDKAGALPPAVYYSQPPHSKGMFHDDSTAEGQEGMEQIMPQVTDDDGDSHVPSNI